MCFAVGVNQVVGTRRPLLGHGFVQFDRVTDAKNVATFVKSFTMRKEFGGDRFTGSIVELQVCDILLYHTLNYRLHITVVCIQNIKTHI